LTSTKVQILSGRVAEECAAQGAECAEASRCAALSLGSFSQFWTKCCTLVSAGLKHVPGTCFSWRGMRSSDLGTLEPWTLKAAPRNRSSSQCWQMLYLIEASRPVRAADKVL
jgi:hypothetical protein